MWPLTKLEASEARNTAGPWRSSVLPQRAAKGGLKMLTRNICSEYGEANIQCNGIGPGYIETPQTAPLRERQADGSRCV